MREGAGSSLARLAALERARGHPVVVFDAMVEDDAVAVLYECLRRIGRTDRIGLLLSTLGGSVTTARRIAMLLREFTRHVAVLVPYRARSAGTLLCLGADELVLGPMAELSPIDPKVRSAGTLADAPDSLSAEDVRAFPRMAEDWFGVDAHDDRIQVLALVAQRVFPPSLSALYRADRLTRDIADELLRHHLSDADDELRAAIVERLVGGYSSHDHPITRADAEALGLRVERASEEDELLLWDTAAALRDEAFGPQPRSDDGVVTGLVVGGNRIAHKVGRWDERTEGRPSRASWEWIDG